MLCYRFTWFIITRTKKEVWIKKNRNILDPLKALLKSESVRLKYPESW